MRIHVQVFDGTSWITCPVQPFPVYADEDFRWEDDPTDEGNNYLNYYLTGIIGRAYDDESVKFIPQFAGRGFPPGFRSPSRLYRKRGTKPRPRKDGSPPKPEYTGGHFEVGRLDGKTHATLAELQALDWDATKDQVRVGAAYPGGSPFRRWVFGLRMANIADKFGGPENVRVIMGVE